MTGLAEQVPVLAVAGIARFGLMLAPILAVAGVLILAAVFVPKWVRRLQGEVDADRVDALKDEMTATRQARELGDAARKAGVGQKGQRVGTRVGRDLDAAGEAVRTGRDARRRISEM